MTSAAAKRVLLIYSRVGGGHLTAARALAEELELSGLATTRLVDAYMECGRFPLTLFPAGYAWLTRGHPRLWSLLYHATQRGLDPKLVLGAFLRSGLRRVFAEYRPDLVLSVLPVVNGLVAEAAAQVGARFEVVFTDWHSVHPLWVARGVHYYTAPTESARGDAIGFGAPPATIDVVGMPVRCAFRTPGSDAPPLAGLAGLAALGLDPERFTVLAMVGAEGSPRALRSIARLALLDLPLQLVVVCGRNQALRQRVERLPGRVPLHAVGFVDNVADLMHSADVLVTKAGGLTLAEAFCSGVPVVIHDLLPGQEAGNLAYALERGAVAYAPDPDELARVVAELYADPDRRAALGARGRHLARPDAASQIVRNVVQRAGWAGTR